MFPPAWPSALISAAELLLLLWLTLAFPHACRFALLPLITRSFCSMSSAARLDFLKFIFSHLWCPHESGLWAVLTGGTWALGHKQQNPQKGGREITGGCKEGGLRQALTVF